MRFTPEEKRKIIQLVQASSQSTAAILRQIQISHSTYYKWLSNYQKKGLDGLVNQNTAPKKYWNSITPDEQRAIIQLTLQDPIKTPAEIAGKFTEQQQSFISASTVYRILNQYDIINDSSIRRLDSRRHLSNVATRVNQIWCTEFIFIKMTGWGYYYLLVLLDDYSRYVVGRKLLTAIQREDVQNLVRKTLSQWRLNSIDLKHHARLLTDNSPHYFTRRLKNYLQDNDLRNVHGNVSNTRLLSFVSQEGHNRKNIIHLFNYHLPAELERQIDWFIQRYHQESHLPTSPPVSPEAVYCDQTESVLTNRKALKADTMARRKRRNLDNRDDSSTQSTES